MANKIVLNYLVRSLPPPPPPRMVEFGKRLFLIQYGLSLIRLPFFIVLAYLEVPELAKEVPKDRQTDRRTEIAITMSLSKSQCHNNEPY